MNNKIKTIVSILSGLYLVAFADGALSLNLSGDVYVILGLVEMGLMIWMLKIVFGKEFNSVDR